MIVSELTERELIARIRQRLQAPPDWLIVGIGDDAAIVDPERNRLEVLTVDALIEGIHFDRRFTPPEAIGHRALAINLSDLAAMGATPRLALLSLALPPDLPCDEFETMVAALASLALHHRLHVVGGNLTRSPGPLMIDVTLVGTVKRRQTLTRGGAQPWDEIYVSGTLGAAAAGLQILKARSGISMPQHATPIPVDRSTDLCVNRYLYPEPRVRLGLLLGRNRVASACMDLSDGLADAVHQIAAASGVGVRIDADALPIEPAARSWFETETGDPLQALMETLTRGDDYELVFAVRPRLRGRLKNAVRYGGVPITRIGTCTEAGAVILHRGGSRAGEEPLPSGYSHFR